MRIAIVDDSASVRMMINICLDQLGITENEVTEFSSAIEALDDFNDNAYDIIFCDLHMPQMDGYTLVKILRTELEHMQKVRIVMVTAEEDGCYKDNFRVFGVHQFIKKPIVPASFLHHIKPLIDKVKRR